MSRRIQVINDSVTGEDLVMEIEYRNAGVASIMIDPASLVSSRIISVKNDQGKVVLEVDP